MQSKYLIPNWPAAKKIHAYCTTRRCDIKQNTYGNYDPNLFADLNLPHEPCWIKQEHTNIVVNADNNFSTRPIADAVFTTKPNIVCAVFTADCVPILICDEEATVVAAVHAGWKGIANGVIEATLKSIATNNQKLLAWLGPAIGPNCFEVGNEVREIFIQGRPEAVQAFKVHRDRWLANIYLLATQRLQACGVSKIFGGEYCTFSQPELFFSYRRDGFEAGRMVSLIWRE